MIFQVTEGKKDVLKNMKESSGVFFLFKFLICFSRFSEFGENVLTEQIEPCVQKVLTSETQVRMTRIYEYYI